MIVSCGLLLTCRIVGGDMCANASPSHPGREGERMGQRQNFGYIRPFALVEPPGILTFLAKPARKQNTTAESGREMKIVLSRQTLEVSMNRCPRIRECHAALDTGPLASFSFKRTDGRAAKHVTLRPWAMGRLRALEVEK
ncbi:hypothetical protein LZ30DRAFT_288216 [Colletotrichum cereale]|nr:hypothetical protein LZ30DRAFT_288216 [Colletotrichum cereale]